MPKVVLLLLQVPVPPDAVGLVKLSVNPTQRGPAPTIDPALGDTFTVTVVVVNADPHDALISVKVIIVVPPVIPVTIPVMASTDPTGELLLLQNPEPPEALALLNVIVKPVQTVFKPVIVPAIGDTLTSILVVVVAEPQNALVSV